MTQEPRLIEIDYTGDMFIKTIEYALDSDVQKIVKAIQKTTLIRVSKQVLMDNSRAFKKYLETSDTYPNTTLEIDNVSTRFIEIWLRIFHDGELPESKWQDLQKDDIKDIAKLGMKYEFKMSRFNARFAFWLGEQDLRTVSIEVIQHLGELCETFQHRFGGECIALMTGKTHNPQLPHAFVLFPPVPEMSLLQSTYQIQLFGIVSP